MTLTGDVGGGDSAGGTMTLGESTLTLGAEGVLGR